MSRPALVITILLAVGLTAVGCIVDADPKSLAYEMRRLGKTEGPCGAGDDGSCGSVTLEYPEFLDTEKPDTTARLNAAIAEMILAPASGEDPAMSPSALADEFVTGWANARREFPDAASTRTWNLDRHVRVIFEGPGALTLVFEETAFTGGAHGTHRKSYSSFDPLDGERLRLSAILDDGYESRLATLAERRFREARGLSPDADLAEAGFEFGERSIVPEDNFGVVADGLVFRFNPYDVAPYAKGPTEFTVTREDLGHLVR